MSGSPNPSAAALGQHGERLVAQWLQQQGWSIVALGWATRWGELDIVAYDRGGQCAGLAFVEVKTRSQGNWDAEGLYAITPAKQTKLWKTAQLFLAQHPQWADIPCRFDVALVSGRRSSARETLRSPCPSSAARSSPIVIGQPILRDGYVLTLHTYLEAAFEGNF